MNRARCAYQGIELADLAEHSTYGRGIVDIDLEIAGASADSDDIVAADTALPISPLAPT